MFKKDNRYITRGINEEVDIRLQLAMWYIIDILKNDGQVKLDYLQIFKIENENNFVKIEHEQEVPKYRSTHILDIADIKVNGKMKVYVIDSEEYSTMLLPSEY
ncbi:Staphylococcal protein of uncharacterised function (DUF960) [uncultured Clostridium sp.]|uniref:DUF960 domain-containing protein n=1 Tax=uncultured Clostridium sp. TaxID=59620 RepID=UPI0008220C6A|nr:DUF960 domain-containing protein [uncultured Clostridium sp.]SCK02035.1 Staphylococcal protein of uncharacterised function (DUF960) [uncultured Clostridium sp.]